MSEMDAKAKALFERSVQQLDEATVRRLRLARRSTLAATPPATAWRGWSAGFAVAAVLALGLAWWLPRDAVAPVAPGSSVAALPVPADEPVLAEEDEDADLYAWLGEAPVAADDAEQRL